MSTPKVIDFTWEIRESIKQSEVMARHETEQELNRQLSGKKVQVSHYERVGIKVEKELTPTICTVGTIEVDDEGYGITIITHTGAKIVPHPPVGIVIVEDES